MKPQNFPLTWPDNLPRTLPEDRIAGRFTIDFRDAFDQLVAEAERLHDDAHRDVIVSTNVPLSANDLPLVSVVKKIRDPGVCVYVFRDGRPYAIALDTYREVGHNIRAIYATICALRTIARHGSAGLLAQAMHGFSREIAAGAGDVSLPMLVEAR